jgi:hypothetical protein
MPAKFMNKLMLGVTMAAFGAGVVILKRRIAAVLLGGAWDGERAVWLEDLRVHARVAGYVEMAGWLLVALGLLFLIVGAVKLRREATLH